MAGDATTISLHETFVVLGADSSALEAFRRQLTQSLDVDKWGATVSLGRPERLDQLREQWINDLATERVCRWLGQQPAVTRAKLKVDIPVRFDVEDSGLRSTQIGKTDVVVNMLSPAFQNLIAWDCVNHGKHMISVSYREKEVRHLDMDAKRRGVLLLCEMGLDDNEFKRRALKAAGWGYGKMTSYGAKPEAAARAFNRIAGALQTATDADSLLAALSA